MKAISNIGNLMNLSKGTRPLDIGPITWPWSSSYSGGWPDQCSRTCTRQESITNLYQSRSGGRPDRCSRMNRGISHDGTYNKQWRSTGSMQLYLLKNSSRSTLLQLLRSGQSRKSKWLVYWIDCCLFTIAGVRYLYPKSKHESYLIMIRYNLRYKGKHS